MKPDRVVAESHAAIAAQWNASQYELIDFGDGRKLERFGHRVLDRPCPAAEPQAKTRPAQWSSADIVLDENSKPKAAHSSWDKRRLGDEAERQGAWQATHGRIVFNLKITPFGHVGLFPEQVHNWNWLSAQLSNRDPTGTAPVALNLFAYTGGTTLALAGLGASVVHVDASAPAVQWARQNANSSGMQDCPIRWITEDARKFVARELRRGNFYDIVVLDPPSYGHGPTGKRWEIGLHLPGLLEEAQALLRKDGQSLLLISAHSEYPSLQDIAEFVQQTSPIELSRGRLSLVDPRQRLLDAGFFVRARY